MFTAAEVPPPEVTFCEDTAAAADVAGLRGQDLGAAIFMDVFIGADDRFLGTAFFFYLLLVCTARYSIQYYVVHRFFSIYRTYTPPSLSLFSPFASAFLPLVDVSFHFKISRLIFCRFLICVNRVTSISPFFRAAQDYTT